MTEKTTESGLLVGEVIAKYRRAKGISQRELEYQLSQQGISARQATISQWENNEAIPEEAKLPALAEILAAPETELRASRLQSVKTIGRHTRELILQVEQDAMRIRTSEILELTDDEAHILTLYRAGQTADLIQYLLHKAGLK